MKFFLTFVRCLLVFVASLGIIWAAAPVQPTLAPKEKKYIPYKITRGDTLAVSIFQESDLTAGGKRVDGRGMINLSLIQEIRVAGLTIIEAQTAIENAYKEGRFLRTPQATITIELYAQRTVTITGKIGQQGKHEL